MRTSILLVLFAVAASASAQTVEMVATKDGAPAGTGTFSITPGPNHSFVQSSSLKLTVNGQQIQLTEVVKIAFDGTTLATESKQYAGGKIQQSLSVLFGTKEATMTDGQGAKTHYPIPPQATIKDPAELWFISIRPRVGSTMSATTFDEGARAWQKTTRTYVVDVPVTVHGAKMMGHQLRDEAGGRTIESIVDDHGLPYEFEVEGFKFTRK